MARKKKRTTMGRGSTKRRRNTDRTITAGRKADRARKKALRKFGF